MSHLVTLYHRASIEERMEGARWYTSARAAIATAALDAGLSLEGDGHFERIVGVAAALSPRMSWAQNLRVTGLWLQSRGEERPPSVMHARHEAARKVWAQGLGALSGPKVTAFADNLLHGQASQRVTLDVWALRAAYDLGRDKTPPAMTARRYAETEAQYLAAAKAVGVAPCVFQATLWVFLRKGGA